MTGAASGMGRSLALELAQRGCHLALSDVDEAGLAETAAWIAARSSARSVGMKVTTARVNVAVREEVFAWADQVAREHGRVHLVFNNAGVALSALAENVRAEDLHWIMEINFFGVVWGTQAFMPHLKASGEGHVVNTSSLFGLLSVPGNAAYNASKFAVRGYTEALRMELELSGAPVSATCVHPGGVRTRIARSARIDPQSMALSHISPEEAIERFDRLLNTTSAERAAGQILRAVENNRRRVLVGADAWWMDKLVRLLGSAYQPLILAFARWLGRP
ncbi:MAG: hypothetical protein RL695_129 [Pseudomonadota bacterium]